MNREEDLDSDILAAEVSDTELSAMMVAVSYFQSASSVVGSVHLIFRIYIRSYS